MERLKRMISAVLVFAIASTILYKCSYGITHPEKPAPAVVKQSTQSVPQAVKVRTVQPIKKAIIVKPATRKPIIRMTRKPIKAKPQRKRTVKPAIKYIKPKVKARRKPAKRMGTKKRHRRNIISKRTYRKIRRNSEVFYGRDIPQKHSPFRDTMNDLIK